MSTFYRLDAKDVPWSTHRSYISKVHTALREVAEYQFKLRGSIIPLQMLNFNVYHSRSSTSDTVRFRFAVQDIENGGRYIWAWAAQIIFVKDYTFNDNDANSFIDSCRIEFSLSNPSFNSGDEVINPFPPLPGQIEKERDKESLEKREPFEDYLGKGNRDGIIDFDTGSDWKTNNGDGTYTYKYREKDLNGEWVEKEVTIGYRLVDGELVPIDTRTDFDKTGGGHYSDSSSYLNAITGQNQKWSNDVKGIPIELTNGMQGEVLGVETVFGLGVGATAPYVTSQQAEALKLVQPLHKASQSAYQNMVEVSPGVASGISGAIKIGVKSFVPFVAISSTLGDSSQSHIWDMTQTEAKTHEQAVKKGDYLTVTNIVSGSVKLENTTLNISNESIRQFENALNKQIKLDVSDLINSKVNLDTSTLKDTKVNLDTSSLDNKKIEIVNTVPSSIDVVNTVPSSISINSSSLNNKTIPLDTSSLDNKKIKLDTEGTTVKLEDTELSFSENAELSIKEFKDLNLENLNKLNEKNLEYVQLEKKAKHDTIQVENPLTKEKTFVSYYPSQIRKNHIDKEYNSNELVAKHSEQVIENVGGFSTKYSNIYEPQTAKAHTDRLLNQAEVEGAEVAKEKIQQFLNEMDNEEPLNTYPTNFDFDSVSDEFNNIYAKFLKERYKK